MQHDTKTRHVYINVTEIRGMPLIIIEAYQALFIFLILIFLRWVIFAIDHTCRHNDNNGEIIATAHPIRRVRQWVASSLLSPTTRGSTSYFSDDSVETKEDDPEDVTPTAAAIRPTDGLDSNE